jgi:hypothetical protein
VVETDLEQPTSEDVANIFEPHIGNERVQRALGMRPDVQKLLAAKKGANR